jgi:hypothetical protein
LCEEGFTIRIPSHFNSVANEHAFARPSDKSGRVQLSGDPGSRIRALTGQPIVQQGRWDFGFSQWPIRT